MVVKLDKPQFIKFLIIKFNNSFEENLMQTQQKYPLTLQLEAEAVEIFRNVSDTDQEKLEILVSSLFKEYKKSDHETLKKTMDEISQKAQARGLTPEILEAILLEED